MFFIIHQHLLHNSCLLFCGSKSLSYCSEEESRVQILLFFPLFLQTRKKVQRNRLSLLLNLLFFFYNVYILHILVICGCALIFWPVKSLQAWKTQAQAGLSVIQFYRLPDRVPTFLSIGSYFFSIPEINNSLSVLTEFIKTLWMSKICSERARLQHIFSLRS